MPYSSLPSANFTPIDSQKLSSMNSPVAKPQTRSRSPMKLLLPISMVAFVLSISAFTGLSIFQYVNSNAVGSKAAFEDKSSLVTTLKKTRSADELKKEKEILDTEAANLNIDVGYEDARARLLAESPDIATNSSFSDALSGMKYIILRDKIVQKDVESTTAYVIGYWTPPLDYPDAFSDQQKEFYNKARQAGDKAIPEIKSQLASGTDPLQIVQSISVKYADLKDIIGLNGRLFSKGYNEYFFVNPHIYQQSDISTKQQLYSTLFNTTVKAGDIKIVADDTGPGSAKWVVKIVEVNHSQYKSYDEWLDAKLKESLSNSANQ